MTDLDEAADELYAIAPAELDGFATRRTELSKAARADGDRELATKITALKKPVLAAALVNALVNSQPKALAELSELAAELRDAHRNLRGPELRALSERRQQVLKRLTQLGRKTAGRPVSGSVLDQLRATFEAAIADEAAEQAVRSGRLTAALSYSGFGEVDLTEAIGLPPRLRAVPDLAEEASATDEAPELSPSERRRAEQALRRAESASAAAKNTLAEAADRLTEAADAEAELKTRIESLTAELAEARDQVAALAKATAAADREHARAQRAAERAEHALNLAADLPM